MGRDRQSRSPTIPAFTAVLLLLATGCTDTVAGTWLLENDRDVGIDGPSCPDTTYGYCGPVGFDITLQIERDGSGVFEMFVYPGYGAKFSECYDLVATVDAEGRHVIDIDGFGLKLRCDPDGKRLECAGDDQYFWFFEKAGSNDPGERKGIKRCTKNG